MDWLKVIDQIFSSGLGWVLAGLSVIGALLWGIFTDLGKDLSKKFITDPVANFLKSDKFKRIFREHWLAVVGVIACLCALLVFPPGRPTLIVLALVIPTALYAGLNVFARGLIDQIIHLGAFRATLRTFAAILAPLVFAVALPLDVTNPLPKIWVSVVMPPDLHDKDDSNLLTRSYNSLMSALAERWTGTYALFAFKDWTDLTALAGTDARVLQGKIQSKLDPNSEARFIAQPSIDEQQKMFVISGTTTFLGDTADADRIDLVPIFRFPDQWTDVASKLTAVQIANLARREDLDAKDEKNIADSLFNRVRDGMKNAINVTEAEAGVCLKSYLESLPQSCDKLRCVAQISDDLTPLVNAIRVASDGTIAAKLSTLGNTKFEAHSPQDCTYHPR